MNENDIATSLGCGGYRGSPAEREDRAAGIVVGGTVKWFSSPPGPKEDFTLAIIEKIIIRPDCEPRFFLVYDDPDGSGRVMAFRDEIGPV